MTAVCWYFGRANRSLNPPPEYMTVSQATSGAFAVLFADSCVAPTAVTYGQVAVNILARKQVQQCREIYLGTKG